MNTSALRWLLTTVWVLTLPLTAMATPPAPAIKAADASVAPVAAPSAQPPLDFVKAVYGRLLEISGKSKKLDVLHQSIGDEMRTFMDYSEMAVRTLGKSRWAGLKPAQKAEFVDLLEGMVRRTYVKRFKPGREIKVTYNDKVRISKSGRAQVKTTIHIKRSKAGVDYSMVNGATGWRVYDIIVDDASQVHVYRRSFAKILKQEDWAGLIKRMKKSAGRS